MAFTQYAQYYDTIYKSKNYKQECAYLEKLFHKYGPNGVRTILDLGCGTANHMIPLVGRGYKVAGVDASAQMLKLADQKLNELGYNANLTCAKLQSFQLNRKFDVVLCMFSVVDYITRKKDLNSMFANVAGHMKKNSLFIFDFWNDSAVESYYSPVKRNLYKVNGSVLERSSTTKVYPEKRLCEVQYTCSVKKNRRLVKSDEEKHVLRYFSIDEMRSYLENEGLKVIDVHPFLNMNGKIKKNTWDVTIVAQKM